MTVKELKAILAMCDDEQEVMLDVSGYTHDGDVAVLTKGLDRAEEHSGILYLMN